MSDDDFVTVGEAARMRGVSPETIRRYERAGLLTAVWTPGGQRRFRRSDVERPGRDGAASLPEGASSRRVAAIPTAQAGQPPEPPAAVPPWEARRANAAADLDVTRAEIARREEIRQYHETRRQREEATRALEIAQAAAAQADAEARAEAARRHSEQQKQMERKQRELDICVGNARQKCFWEPAAVKAEVERYLAAEARIGASLQLIEAEVDAILERHRSARESEARRRAEEEARKLRDTVRRALLIRHGESRALSGTLDSDEWDHDTAAEARAAVTDRLHEVVQPDWSERQVERAVDAVLRKWI